MTEEDMQDQVSRAEWARQAMDNPVLKEGFKALETAVLEALIECKKEDDAGRYRLSESIKAIRQTKTLLQLTLESGQVASRELRELKAGRKPFF